MCYYPDILYTCRHRFPRPFPVTICKSRTNLIREYVTLDLSKHTESLTESVESMCPHNEPSPDESHVHRAARRCDCCILDDMEMIMEAQKEFRSRGIRNWALKKKFEKLKGMVGVLPEERPKVFRMGEVQVRLVPAEDKKAPAEVEGGEALAKGEAPPGGRLVPVEVRMGPPEVKAEGYLAEAESAGGAKRKGRGCLEEVEFAGDAKRVKSDWDRGVYAC